MRGQKCFKCGHYMTFAEAYIANEKFINFERESGTHRVVGINVLSNINHIPCSECGAVDLWVKPEDIQEKNIEVCEKTESK